ncbi:MAG: PilZ domain-containing protein [Planctomycetota bacterium]|jgi:hypothetical protein
MPEKRKFKRVPVALGLSCSKVDAPSAQVYKGRTVNVSPGGIYFETGAAVFEAGNLLKVMLSIPPTTGLLEFGGEISGLARVLRVCGREATQADAGGDCGEYGVALEFCQKPRLCW